MKGLSVVVGHKERAFERVQKRGLVDVAVGIVDEYAGFHISLCVDVQIVPSTGDTAAHILGVVLEVHGKDRLRLTEFPDTAVNSLSLAAHQEAEDLTPAAFAKWTRRRVRLAHCPQE